MIRTLVLLTLLFVSSASLESAEEEQVPPALPYAIINTPEECRAAGGWWHGTIEGRGRLTGCSLPTKDAGKPCATSSDCESVCLEAFGEEKDPSAPGRCFGWSQYKGCHIVETNPDGSPKIICVE